MIHFVPQICLKLKGTQLNLFLKIRVLVSEYVSYFNDYYTNIPFSTKLTVKYEQTKFNKCFSRQI